MVTINQILNKTYRKYPSIWNRTTRPALANCPQKKATCLKTFEMSPKKPNSAKRKVVKVRISSTGRITTCYIPGEGHSLTAHSIVLIHGGRAQDLPGVKYQIIRGKFDCTPVKNRRRSLSKYGKDESSKRARTRRRK